MKTLALTLLISSAAYATLGSAYVAIAPHTITLESWLTILGAFVITLGALMYVVR